MASKRLVYDHIRDDDFGWLYALMAHRDPRANISHSWLPTWEDHCAYWKDKRDRWECRIVSTAKGERIGYYYVTDKDEIGVHVNECARLNGYDAAILKYIVSTHAGKRLLANVAPNNPWGGVLEDNGLTELQTTYVRDC
jgi:hypothetical protein